MFAKSSTMLYAIVGWLAVSAVASPVPENQDKVLLTRAYLGGVDVERGCQVENKDPGFHAVTIGNNWGDWKCRKGDEWRDVNMNAACVTTFGRVDVYAKHGISVWSWECHST
jgi:hypothetical protein